MSSRSDEPDRPVPGRVPSPAWIAAALRTVSDPVAALDASGVAGIGAGLAEAADIIATSPLISTDAEQVEAFAYLLSVLANAIDAVALDPDPAVPLFSAPHQVLRADWGAANPDGVYRHVALDDAGAYRIDGHLGNADYLGFDLRTSPILVAIGRDDLRTAADGGFVLRLGGPARPENWWPLPPGTSGLLVREFFSDWASAQRSSLRITRTDPAVPNPLDPGRVAARFARIGEWLVDGGVRFWLERSEQASRTMRNRFRPDVARAGTGLPVYTHGLWDLAPEEALVIEWPDPQASYWGLQLASTLWHTFDYATRITSRNASQSVADADGVHRFVLAHRDPGVPGWLDTMGLQRGIFILRCHGAESFRVPETRVVPLSSVSGEPAGRPTDAVVDRAAEIRQRCDGVARMILD